MTLQTAYNGGNTIVETIGRPTTISNAADVDALLELIATGEVRALRITHDGVAPPSELGVLDVQIADPTGSWPALMVEQETLTGRVIRVVNTGRTEVLFDLTPQSIFFSAALASLLYANIAADQGKNLVIQTDRQTAGDGSTVGELRIGPAFGPDDVDGGLTIEASGRTRLNKHAQGATVADDPRGALRLHNLVLTTEAADPPAEGDLHLLTVDSGGTARDKGFRGYREAAWAMLMRGAQSSFGDGDLTGGVLTYVHNLDTEYPLLQIWDDTGALLPASATTWTAVNTSNNDVAITFDAGLLPLVGLWRVTAGGF